MKATKVVDTAAASSAHVGPATPPPQLEQPRRRRRRGAIALMVLLVVCGAAAAWWAVDRTTVRIAVVAVVEPVAWGQTIQADDLAMVEIVDEPLLTPVPWADRDSIIGARATRDLAAGTLLTRNSTSRTPQVPGEGKALVGVAVRPSQAPVTPLKPGDHVLVVPRAGQAADASSAAPGASQITGIVYAVGSVNSDGARTVDVIVDNKSAPVLAEASAAGRIALILIPREGN